MAKRLLRDKRRAVLGGVAAGIGQYLDIDPVLVRLTFVLLAFAKGVGLLVYLIGWIVIPRGDARATEGGTADSSGAAPRFPIFYQAVPEAPQAQLAAGVFLVVIGSLLLLHNLGWLHWPDWLDFHTLWPMLLVAAGAGLLLKSRRTRPA